VPGLLPAGIGSAIVEVCGSSSPSGDVVGSPARARCGAKTETRSDKNAVTATRLFMGPLLCWLRDHQVNVHRLVRIAIAER